MKLSFELLFSLFDQRLRPAGTETGCDDEGAWCPGTDTGQNPAPSFISPAKVILQCPQW